MKKVILFINDDPVWLKLVAEGVRELGPDFVGESTVDPLAILADPLVERYHRIVTDWKMPGMDGIQFIRRAKEKYPIERMALMSGYPEVEYRQLALKEGITHFIPKTTDLDKFLLAVRTFSS